jgi:hypothetical protein
VTWFLLAGLARAEEPTPEAPKVSTTFTEDFEIRYWKIDGFPSPDPAHPSVYDYVEQVNRFNANVRSGKWAVDAQIDEVAMFGARYFLDDVEVVERPLVPEELFSPAPGISYVNLEKVRATYESQSASLLLGDGYAAFGRGIALNLNRNVDIDIDTSIQGFKGMFRPGAWDVTVVGGQLNRQQVLQDNPNCPGAPEAPCVLFGDVRHAVGGVRVERFGLGPANLGAHGVVYKYAVEEGLSRGFEQLGEEHGLTAIGGLTAELTSVAGFDWYVEGDTFGFQDVANTLPGADPGDPGYALYLSASTYPGPFVLLVEGKRYYQTDRVNAPLGGISTYEVAIAPTLEYERAITEDSAAALNSNDITGGRFQLDWAAIPGKFTPYVAFALFRDEDLGALHFNTGRPETITHPMAGLEYVGEGTAVIGNFGFRTDDRDTGVVVESFEPIAPAAGCGQRPDRDRQIHGDLTVEVPVGPLSFDAALAGELFCWGVNGDLQQSDYFESETSYTLSYGSDVAVTWYLDYTTNPLVSSIGNLGDERLYGAAELQVKPAAAWTIKAFYGAYKAGIRCSGGQCRLLPGFDGARLSAVASF